jgi:hypothetical protein
MTSHVPVPDHSDLTGHRRCHPLADTAISPLSSLHRGWLQVPQNSVLLPQAMILSQPQVMDCDMSVVEQA